MLSDHTFVPPSSTSKRSPCPALNALANHGYLPRNGENITFIQLITTLSSVYNISWPLAILLSALGILLCGRRGRLNLDDLAGHNLIEHDASLVHADATPNAQKAPIYPDPTLLNRMLALSPLTLSVFAQWRVERERESARKLDLIHEEIAVAETSLAWLVMGQGERKLETKRVVASETVRGWFGEERLPEGWTRPVEKTGMMDVLATNQRVREFMRRFKMH